MSTDDARAVKPNVECIESATITVSYGEKSASIELPDELVTEVTEEIAVRESIGETRNMPFEERVKEQLINRVSITTELTGGQ